MQTEVATILNTFSPAPSDGRLVIPSWAAALCPQPGQPKRRELKGQNLRATMRNHSGPCHNLVSLTLTDIGSLAAAEFQCAVTAAYLAVLSDLAKTESPHPIRMWNFIGSIHDCMGPGIDRYRVFNSGRFDAFSQLARTPTADCTSTFCVGLPAASGVGQTADALTIYALGARSPGIAIENPWQIPAFDYSTAHGPRPPCFSRAVIAELGPPDQSHSGRPTLLVSGTASIRGEDSTHAGDLSAQFNETLENIERLARSITHPCQFSIKGLETARIYYPRRADGPWLKRTARARLGLAASIELVSAAICRAELLVEIEATISPVATDTPARGPSA